MPQFEIQFEGRDAEGRTLPGGPGLAVRGPVLEVVVAVPPKLAQSLQKAQRIVPGPIPGLALIDTGATRTSVDAGIVAALAIPPNGKTQLGTAGGIRDAALHPIQIIFPTMGNLNVFLPQAISCDLAGAGIPGGGKLAVLFGRDLLMHFVMIYNGPAGRITLLPG